MSGIVVHYLRSWFPHVKCVAAPRVPPMLEASKVLQIRHLVDARRKFVPPLLVTANGLLNLLQSAVFPGEFCKRPHRVLVHLVAPLSIVFQVTRLGLTPCCFIICKMRSLDASSFCTMKPRRRMFHVYSLGMG
ncbi:hypothetical protein BN1723_014264 [Verticillium longisporum]|uniref:Uncharacterized protein n=1 Tax=Verticillium longisporum TaxID=100787 RepID=A0A0G4M4U4_VERLO|nr:hypothetical protein BN1723_014264 [Verticillium longisporum]